MSRPSQSTAHAYEPVEHPILESWPEYWWMEERQKSNLIESIALAYGGDGYRSHSERSRER